MSTCAGAELPEPASLTPAAALVLIRRPLLVARLLQLLLPLLQLPMPLLLALFPLLILASNKPRRHWIEGLGEVDGEAKRGGEERAIVVAVDEDGPIVVVAVPFLSRAAAILNGSATLADEAYRRYLRPLADGLDRCVWGGQIERTGEISLVLKKRKKSEQLLFFFSRRS